MSYLSIPFSAPAEKSAQDAGHTSSVTTIEQTEQMLTCLRVWAIQLEGWLTVQQAQAIDSVVFETAYHALSEAGLDLWAEALGIEELRIAVGQNPVLPAWLGVTKLTIEALEARLTSFKGAETETLRYSN